MEENIKEIKKIISSESNIYEILSKIYKKQIHHYVKGYESYREPTYVFCEILLYLSDNLLISVDDIGKMFGFSLKNISYPDDIYDKVKYRLLIDEKKFPEGGMMDVPLYTDRVDMINKTKDISDIMMYLPHSHWMY
jgi:hypothetical protein